MRETKNDGGPAFPREAEEEDANGMLIRKVSVPGMTLYDYFAAKALQGILAGRIGEFPYPTSAARQAYGYAKDMLKEREKP